MYLNPLKLGSAERRPPATAVHKAHFPDGATDDQIILKR